MSTPLDAIMRIRVLREKTEAARARDCQAHLDTALQQQILKHKEQDEYQGWRLQKETELFADLQKQPVNVRGLDEFNLTISNLREREAVLAKQVDEARDAVKTAREQLAAARKAYAEAVRGKEKLAECCALEHARIRRKKEYQEELNQDEMAALRFRAPDGV